MKIKRLLKIRSQRIVISMKRLKILELFGGVGAPRCALRNIGVPVKSIDYVEIDEKAVRSYNAMFKDDMEYGTQSVVGWNLKPDILIHGSPCQDFSIAGKQKGADEGSETRSSLMWETLKIIRNFGEWKPKVVIWENVKNVRSKYMVHNHEKYLQEMANIGYKNTFALLDARDFGLPQHRERYFTVSVLDKYPFMFYEMNRKSMKSIWYYIEDDNDVPDYYTIKSPSMIKNIDPENFDKGLLKTLSVIKEYALTISTKQDRCPNAGIVKRKDGSYRILTERECWRLMGFSDEDYDHALIANPSKPGKKNSALYKQAGNSIAVPILESMFEVIVPKYFGDIYEE